MIHKGLLRWFLPVVLLCFCWAAQAQQAQQASVVPEEWGVVSARAEAVLQAGLAQTTSLEELRDELAEWRSRFLAAQETNAGRIATVRAEIEALGPAPAEGETEPEELAAQRAALQAELNQLLVPVRAAQGAFQASESLIERTDSLIESRRTEALLQQDRAPVNPALWWPALSAAGAWFIGLASSLTAPFSSATSRAFFADQGIQVGVLFFLAVVLIFRSGTWTRRLRDRWSIHEDSSPLARIGLFALSIARMVLPVLGLYAAVNIIRLIGATGLAVERVVEVVPLMGATILAVRWLAGHVFPAREETLTVLPFAPEKRVEGRFHAYVLGLVMAAAIFLRAMVESSRQVAQFEGVFLLVLIAVGGITLVRLGHVLLRTGQAAKTADDSGGFGAQMSRWVGRALMVIGAVSPVVTAAGYVNLGQAMIWPTLLSLALIVFVGTLQTVVFDAFAVITRRKDRAEDALLPTLVGFGLAVLSLPVFALIWGVRLQTLGEWWVTFLEGFRLGETRISPEAFLTFILVFLAGYFATRLVKGVLRTNVLPKTKLDSGGTNAILSGTGYIGITLAALLAITTAGIDLSGLAIVAGALSVGVGFGLQTIVQNFVSGIILLIERPIKIGDWINVNGMDGFVRQISVRSTRIETFDRQDVIIPNADLIAGTVTNYTLGNSTGRLVLPIGVAYGTDTRRVEAILREVVEAHPMVILSPPPVITFEGFGADSLDFLVRAVLRDILFLVTVRSEINHQIAQRFVEEGIEIPFAQRDIWLRNPEALRAPQPETP
ncbi:MAG: mechanosensitive ion channel domain-containing protein [Pseudomonadota bacterium]